MPRLQKKGGGRNTRAPVEAPRPAQENQNKEEDETQDTTLKLPTRRLFDESLESQTATLSDVIQQMSEDRHLVEHRETYRQWFYYMEADTRIDTFCRSIAQDMKQTHGKDLSAFITSISIRFNALTKALAGSPVFSETLMKGVPVAIGIGKTLKLADGIGLKRTSATDYEIVANSTLWADGPRASVSFPGNTVPIFTLKERSDGLMEVSIEHSSLVDEEARITLPSSSNDKVIITRNPKGSTRMYDVRGADFYPIKYKDADEAMLALNKAISSNVVATIIHRSSSKVRGNKEVMLKALTKAPYLFRLASKELREDSKFVRTVIEKTRDVQIMYHALLSRQSMEEIIIPVIKESPLSITFVPYSVYSDTFVERIREFFTNNAHKLEFDRWKSLAEDYHKSKQ